MCKERHLVVLVMVMVLFVPALAGAADYYVSPDGTGTCSQADPCAFQTALDNAQSDGTDSTIYVMPGTYDETHGLSSTLTYSTTDGDGTLTIQAQDPNDKPVLDGKNGSSNIQILDIDNDSVPPDGDAGADITIRNLVFQNGSSTSGGGLYVHTGLADVTLENNTFSGNSATYDGGGANIFTGSGNITLTNNTFSGNSVVNNRGGGAKVNTNSGNVTLTNNTFSGNSAKYGGGGSYVYTNSSATLANNTFSGNSDGWSGGGVEVSASDLILTNNTFSNNSANKYGGGADVYADSGLQATNNTFSGNSAGLDGGGAYIDPGYVTADVTNNTFYGNTSGNNGGGLYASLYYDGGGLNAYNNILYQNTASGNADDLFADVSYSTNPVTINNNDFSCNDFNGNSSCLQVTDTTTYSQANNISSDPLFEDPANSDFHLQATSPCIDAGDNNAPSLPTTDFEGDQRIVNIVDIGADEYNTVTLTSPNGGETILSGGSHTITWSARQGSVSFDLEYSINDGGTWRTIATGVTGTSYSWSVPAVAGNKRKCRVRITAYDSGSNQIGQDTSDDRFMIEVIKITSPNGGGTYNRGDTVPITWSTNATKTPITKVVIKYHKVGVSGWVLIDVIKGSNPGTYSWTIPATLATGNYKIKVNLWDANKNRRGADKSDGLFTLN